MTVWGAEFRLRSYSLINDFGNVISSIVKREFLRPVHEAAPSLYSHDEGAMKPRSGATVTTAIVFLVICVLTLPSFFQMYRLMAFNTFPRDDYAPFLLHFVLGKGSWAGSPFGYRVLSVLAAAPLYWLLPLYKFTLQPAADLSYLKATQALAALCYLSAAASATIAFAIVRQTFGRSVVEAALAAAFTVILSAFSSEGGIDRFGIFVIFVLLAILGRPVVFSLLFLLAPFTNEKIVMVFLFLAVSRSIFVPGFLKAHRLQNASIVAGTVIYVLALKIIRLPGNEWQTSAVHWLPQFARMIATSLSSPKGLVLCVIPSLVMIIPCVMFALRSRESTEQIAVPDFLVPLGLLAAALALTDGVNVGHVLSYSLPLTVFALAMLFREPLTGC